MKIKKREREREILKNMEFFLLYEKGDVRKTNRIFLGEIFVLL